MIETKQEEAGPEWAGAPPSQQRAWWPVHEFVEAVVRQANCGPIPAAGTPSWCALSDDDPCKMLSVAIDGEHHVLRVEIAQEHQAKAAKDVAISSDWTRIAREIHQRRASDYIPREAS